MKSRTGVTAPTTDEGGTPGRRRVRQIWLSSRDRHSPRLDARIVLGSDGLRDHVGGRGRTVFGRRTSGSARLDRSDEGQVGQAGLVTTDDLRRSWGVTREHLAKARGELSSAAQVLVSGDFEHYLDHNELELAMDVLVAAGEAGPATAEFWRALSRAAFNMGRTDQGDRFLRRVV